MPADGPSPGLDVLATPRLRGERLRAAHGELLAGELYRDERVMATLGGRVLGEAEQAAALERGLAHWTDHGFGTWVFTAAEDRFVGHGGLRRYELPEEPAPVVALLYHLAADAWGAGYATEIAAASTRVAFEHLGSDVVWSWTQPANHASRRVMEKCGLRFVREAPFAGLAHHFLRVTRSEWEVRTPGARTGS
ncbi:MAG: GNAT family N-acetyltransferase [Planctomycetota bacterium]|nr:GNAT family N-acetyltransferase [Planctomycetota bacterium]